MVVCLCVDWFRCLLLRELKGHYYALLTQAFSDLLSHNNNMEPQCFYKINNTTTIILYTLNVFVSLSFTVIKVLKIGFPSVF